MAPGPAAKRERGGGDAGYISFALARMARAEKAARGEAPPTEALEAELDFLGAALQACGEANGEDRAVLAEYWEEADEALVAALAATLLPEVPDPRLPAPCDLVSRPGADAEAQDAFRELLRAAGPAEPWPVGEDVPFDGHLPARPAAAAGRPAGPLPTPCRSPAAPAPAAPAPRQGPAQGQGAGNPSAAAGGLAPVRPPPAAAERPPAAERPAPGSSFRTASEICPPLPKAQNPAGAAAPAAAPSFGDVSKSILQKKKQEGGSGGQQSEKKDSKNGEGGREWSDEWLRIADPEQLERMVPALEATIHRDSGGRDRITRKDIAGLGFVKTQIEEVLILPQLHPQLFASALTRPARGLLLFGPPGTGKTLLARWIAAECGATFFNVNASSVLSKWIGEAEKTVKALFQLAKDRQPSVIFIDEIDSMLSQRRDGDNESSRRVKNEFLTSLEGADTAADDKLLLVGATNMPWELDPAALRRLPKRLYVPLPGLSARRGLLETQLAKHNSGQGLKGAISAANVEAIAQRTEGFSGSDLQALLREAAMGPVREASAAIAPSLRKRAAGAVGSAGSAGSLVPRDINMGDFECALRRVKPGFNQEQEVKHREFNEEHGTCRGEDAMRDVESEEEEAPPEAGAPPADSGVGVQAPIGA